MSRADAQREYRRRMREGAELVRVEVPRDVKAGLVLSGLLPGRHDKTEVATALVEAVRRLFRHRQPRDAVTRNVRRSAASGDTQRQ